MRKILPTFMLLILFFAAFWYAQSNDFFRSSQEGDEPLFSFQIDQVDTIQVLRLQEQFTLKRSAEGWFLNENSKYPLDKEKIDGWLEELGTYVPDGLVEKQPSDYSRFGLEPPKNEITVSLTDNTSQSVYIGNEQPIEGHHYLRRDQSLPVYQINNESVDLMLSSLLYFTDRRVMPYDLTKIHSIEMQVMDKSWRLERQGKAGDSYNAPWMLGEKTKEYMDIASIIGRTINMLTEEELVSVSDMEIKGTHLKIAVEEFVGGELVKHTVVGEVQSEEQVLLWEMGTFWGYLVDIEKVNVLFNTGLDKLNY